MKTVTISEVKHHFDAYLRDSHNQPVVVTKNGKTQALELDFAQSVLQGQVKVCLFDVQGRLAAMPFKGRLSSTHLTLPLSRAKVGPGAYIIKATLNDKVLFMNNNIILCR